MLTNRDLDELIALRRALHRRPELSGEEGATAQAVVAALPGPDALVTGLGGHGVAAVYRGAAAGPTVMLRCELDGLPIFETGAPEWRSEVEGKGHLCGHDGHMAILLGVARLLARRRPARGRVVLLFQPAEETGAGAAAVLADPRFGPLAPDMAFAFHNMPGLPLGQASIMAGPVNCASRGMKVVYRGRTAHASAPGDGLSPMQAMVRLMPALTALSGGELGPEFRLVTVTHARMGEPAFGIAPGEGEVWATLRTLTDDRMAALVAEAEALARGHAGALEVEISAHEAFEHCENAPQAVAAFTAALEGCGLAVSDALLPMKGSEDFGRFGQRAPAAMALLGAGHGPALHNPDYDFPDDLIAIGVRVFDRLLRDQLG